jgi:hypothetical protein
MGASAVFGRDSLIGLLLLALCVAVCGILIYGIVTGTTWRYTGPAWLAWALGILFVGGAIWGWVSSRNRWPNPTAGQRRRWPWQRGDDRS